MSIIKLSNICKKYDENTVLDNFSLDIEKGDYVCVMGKSGAGKSTLLNIIGLLEKADSGDIEICGKKNPAFRSKIGENLLRNHISYMFQNYGLVENETVQENLKIGTRYLKISKEEENRKILEALEFVGLADYQNKKVYKLSGGEQQRIAIARIMLKPSDIVLADEPTGSLDGENQEIILSLLKKLNDEGKTIVVVTHSPIVEKSAKRCIRL